VKFDFNTALIYLKSEFLTIKLLDKKKSNLPIEICGAVSDKNGSTASPQNSKIHLFLPTWTTSCNATTEIVAVCNV
jgi:hypothetical protein